MLDLCSDLKKKWNILKDFGLFSDSGFIDVYIHNFTVPCTVSKNVYKFENSQQIGYIINVRLITSPINLIPEQKYPGMQYEC